MVRMTQDRGQGGLERRLGAEWRERLDALLTRQLELYGELDALCERQRGLIESGDADRLMGLLGERSRVVGSIAESAACFAPFGEAWAEIEAGLGEAERRELASRLRAVSSLAASIAERDAADGASIRARRDQLADQLAGLGQSRRAVKAYAGPRPAGPRFQDREG